MRRVIWGIILAAIFGGVTYYSGDQIIPEPDYCHFIPTGNPTEPGDCSNRLELTTGLAAFIGWSIGLVLGGKR